jgi:uncharacterized integral membrane protein
VNDTVPAITALTRQDRDLRRPPRWAFLLLAAALTATWSVWALHAFRGEMRTVSMEEFRSDLATGTVLTYKGVTEISHDRVWPPSDETRLSTAPIPEPGAPTTSVDRPIMALVYYVDAWRAPIRIVMVAPFAGAGSDAVDVHELIQELDSAGVRPKVDFVPADDWHPNPSAEWAQVWGVATGVLALVALFAIRPTRGTRWFWFWIFGAPLGLGILTYVVAECLRPRSRLLPSDSRPVDGRLIGVVGFAILGAARLLVPM